jgi:hypothetical protein
LSRTFRFRPRYRGVALTSIGVGTTLVGVAAFALGLALTVPLVSGALGVVLGAGYLASPTWRITVTVDDAGLEVAASGKVRFRLAWADVARLVVSPTTASAYVDGGAPERSLLVPGDGAPAPYDIEDRAALVTLIVDGVRAVHPDRVDEVATLEAARTPKTPPSPKPPKA